MWTLLPSLAARSALPQSKNDPDTKTRCIQTLTDPFGRYDISTALKPANSGSVTVAKVCAMITNTDDCKFLKIVDMLNSNCDSRSNNEDAYEREIYFYELFKKLGSSQLVLPTSAMSFIPKMDRALRCTQYAMFLVEDVGSTLYEHCHTKNFVDFHISYPSVSDIKSLTELCTIYGTQSTAEYRHPFWKPVPVQALSVPIAASGAAATATTASTMIAEQKQQENDDNAIALETQFLIQLDPQLATHQAATASTSSASTSSASTVEFRYIMTEQQLDSCLNVLTIVNRTHHVIHGDCHLQNFTLKTFPVTYFDERGNSIPVPGSAAPSKERMLLQRPIQNIQVQKTYLIDFGRAGDFQRFLPRGHLSQYEDLDLVLDQRNLPLLVQCCDILYLFWAVLRLEDSVKSAFGCLMNDGTIQVFPWYKLLDLVSVQDFKQYMSIFLDHPTAHDRLLLTRLYYRAQASRMLQVNRKHRTISLQQANYDLFQQQFSFQTVNPLQPPQQQQQQQRQRLPPKKQLQRHAKQIPNQLLAAAGAGQGRFRLHTRK